MKRVNVPVAHITVPVKLPAFSHPSVSSNFRVGEAVKILKMNAHSGVKENNVTGVIVSLALHYRPDGWEFIYEVQTGYCRTWSTEENLIKLGT